ncbi:putative Nuclear transcription factor Y subunit C-4 [Quillaja saponaria]|uniref:Nuclear transcription factor Y subunit C-4 n=1 Tax=Quillaja saponaria TaxID=32244 RepID=A0AAD7M1M5_QUISA|nr:putative Nuclear transcription factor Y subunit C-4 [Quillaja saponaria]
MESARGYKPNNLNEMKHLHGGRTGSNSETIMVIKLPDSQILRVISRSLFLAVVLLTLPCFGSIFGGPSSSSYSIVSESDTGFDSVNLESLELLFHDLADEGLLRKGDKALIVSPFLEIVGMIHNLQMLNHNEVDLVMESDLERKSSLPDEAYDLVFTSSTGDTKFVDRILKTNAIVALPLSNNPSNAFKRRANYKIVYLRRYSSIIVAWRKTGLADELVGSSTKRRLCQLETEAKVSLKGLEDVFLEPPRRALTKSTKYFKKFKDLPDLLGDSLEGYKRRVFIGVGSPEENGGVNEWFHENYPKKNQEFEVHNLEVASEDQAPPKHIDVSDWLIKHVKEEDYVVMKAEAEVAEEVIKRKTLCLVDELFLECKNEWWQTEEKTKRRRAYWECLSLYGRLRDEGVAVHQWWG